MYSIDQINTKVSKSVVSQTIFSGGQFIRDVLSSLCVCPWPHSSKADLEGQDNTNELNLMIVDVVITVVDLAKMICKNVLLIYVIYVKNMADQHGIKLTLHKQIWP